MDIHGYIHGYIHVWILDLGYTVDISMDIVQCTPLKCVPVKEVFSVFLANCCPPEAKRGPEGYKIVCTTRNNST